MSQGESKFDSSQPVGWPSDSDWTEPLQPHFQSDQFQGVMTYVAAARKSSTVFPPEEEVFQAYRSTPLAKARVIILGQDPYHGLGQAHGLSFSVKEDIKLPPSLRNIYKEYETDLEKAPPPTGNLIRWAEQGVFLLNTVLTVEEGQANSHRKQGWEAFTDETIRVLNADSNPKVFILWGKPAEKKESLIADPHQVIKSPHPSPLSARRGFFGSRPFSRANEFLQQQGRPIIDW